MELPLIRKIADRVEPGLRNMMHNKAMFGWLPVREGLLRLIGQLEGQQELDEMLAPQAQVLAPDGLHPWVWEPAARMWTRGTVKPPRMRQQSRSITSSRRSSTASTSPAMTS